jgi:hypothetical protein
MQSLKSLHPPASSREVLPDFAFLVRYDLRPLPSAQGRPAPVESNARSSDLQCALLWHVAKSQRDGSRSGGSLALVPRISSAAASAACCSGVISTKARPLW